MARQRPPAPWVAALAGPHEAPSQALLLEELRAVILSCRVRPVAPIPVHDFAARFSLRSIPARDARKALVADGPFAQQVRGGYVVGLLTRQALAELYVVLASLEHAAIT